MNQVPHGLLPPLHHLNDTALAWRAYDRGIANKEEDPGSEWEEFDVTDASIVPIGLIGLSLSTDGSPTRKMTSRKKPTKYGARGKDPKPGEEPGDIPKLPTYSPPNLSLKNDEDPGQHNFSRRLVSKIIKNNELIINAANYKLSELVDPKAKDSALKLTSLMVNPINVVDGLAVEVGFTNICKYATYAANEALQNAGSLGRFSKSYLTMYTSKVAVCKLIGEDQVINASLSLKVEDTNIVVNVFNATGSGLVGGALGAIAFFLDKIGFLPYKVPLSILGQASDDP